MNSIALMPLFLLIQSEPAAIGSLVGAIVGIIVALLFMRWLRRKK